MKQITIGVLAGMGPNTTGPFLDVLMEESRRQYGAKYDVDFPHVIAYSLPTPFYIDRPVDDIEMLSAIREGIKRLAGTGVDFIAMPCNGAHAYYDQLQSEIDIPLLHIVDETVRVIDSVERVAVLQVPLTRGSGVYAKRLSEKGIGLVDSDDLQEVVNGLVSHFKSGGSAEAVQDVWLTLVDELASEGCGAIIIACTDLSPLLDLSSNMPVVDSTEELAKATIRIYIDLKS